MEEIKKEVLPYSKFFVLAIEKKWTKAEILKRLLEEAKKESTSSRKERD